MPNKIKHAYIEYHLNKMKEKYTALKKIDMEQGMGGCLWHIEYLHANAHLLKYAI